MSNDLFLLDSRFDEDRDSYTNITNTGDAFEVFCADLVLRDYKLSYDDIIDGIVGGGLDGGIDGFYVFVNGALVSDVSNLPDLKENISIRLILFQMKHQSRNEQTVIHNLFQHIDYVLTLMPNQDDLDTLFSSELQDKLDIFRSVMKKYGTKHHKLDIEINYCNRATREPNTPANVLANRLVEKCHSSFSNSSAKFEFYGAAKLYAISIRPISKTKELMHISGGLMGDTSECYVALVKLSDFVDFISEGDHLDQNMFEFNVRDFAGDTKPVNRDISETINDNASGADFWWFNNGVIVVGSMLSTLLLSLPKSVQASIINV